MGGLTDQKTASYRITWLVTKKSQRNQQPRIAEYGEDKRGND